MGIGGHRELRRVSGAWRLTTGTLGLVALSALAALAAPRPAPPPKAKVAPIPVGFNRDIRPILSDKCFVCHGPDKGSRKAGLRLDLREEAVARGVIVPGSPEKSRLIARVFAKEAARMMPPVSAHKPLTATQKYLLRSWVAQGAKYEPHWSFVPPPARIPVPKVKNDAWCRTDVDRFVLARLEKEGLKPSPEASRPDWIRRVTLDLTGIPPTPEEVDAFIADTSAQAFDKVVDRLLASPRYGERMATPWLDVARYADSYGYQSDQLSPTWPYRDWVVRAFNENLPYDQFITWQVAGDLLPNATREQRLATAFNRLHRMTGEGGSVPEEWRLEGVADRVATFGTAFLGVTVECAHCHDHKYDPISQRDYYAISAFFNNIDEYGLYDRADIVPSPTLLLPTAAQEQEYAAAKTALKAAERALTDARDQAEGRFQKWLAARPVAPATLADLTGRFDFEQFEGDKLKNLAPEAKEPGVRLDEVPLVAGRVGKAIQLDGENNVNFPALGRFTRHTPFTLAFWMRDSQPADGPRAEPAVIFQACSGTDAGPHGYDLILEKGRLTARMFRHWPGNAIAVRAQQEIPKDVWTHVTVTYDGSSQAAGLRIYLNGKAAQRTLERDHLVKGTGQHTLVFGQRFRDKGFKGGQIDELSIFNRALTPVEAGHLFDGRLTAALANSVESEVSLREYYLSAIDAEARKSYANLAAARQRVVAAEDAQYEIAVMEEMRQNRPTHVLRRGDYDAPRTDENRVERGTPAGILAFDPKLPRNRLGLAMWLTRPDHPLTARVAVNRLWAPLFGRGLVETVENLGIQGGQPSHPELLDWLARDFIGGAWDVKRTLRMLVLSATYRQASAVRPDLLRRDSQNILLARGPSHRLSGEAVRDTALAASGLLDERIGGPPVSPYQPGDLWRESNTMSPAYRQSVGKDLYRRSLYTVLKRTAPMPNMLAFDTVSREVCVARRQRTGTPLQALVLLNDPQFVEAARVLGERMVRESAGDRSRAVRLAFRRLATREPTAGELTLLTSLFDEQEQYFKAHPEDAARLVRIGERPVDPALPAVTVAAATVVAQTVLNLDATIWKR